MNTKGILTTSLIALTFFGCKGPQTTLASPGAGATPGAGSAVATGGTQVEYITDPSLNGMNAFSVTIPAKWHFQGVLYEGAKCVPTPFGVFRASSPDGLSFMERMPALGWIWATGPSAAYLKTNGCLPMNGPMTAQDFLKHLSTTLKVEYVADEPVPQNVVNAGNDAAGQGQTPKSTTESAQALVGYKNGTFAMKGELFVRVDCTVTSLRGIPNNAPPTVYHQCAASARYMAAPETQYSVVEKMWDAPGMGGSPEQAWEQAWLQASLKRTNEDAAQRLNALHQRQSAAMQAQQQRFEHSQAVQQQMHEDFMATMQRGTDMSMARTQTNMNARSTAASDWVDYALDQRTVADPNTGQISKVSSSYTNTWVDSTGKVSYQTNDPNANPNGVMPGTWTKQQAVHGNGQPQ